VEIRVDATYRAVDALLEGGLDVALTNELSDNERLRYVPVFEDELIALMPGDHRLAQRDYLRAQDFAEEPLVLPFKLEESYFYANFVKPAEVRPQHWCTVPLTEAIVAMVQEGLGMSVVARWMILPYLKPSGLKAIRISKRGLYRQWWAVVLNRRTPQYLDDFIELIASKTSGILNEAKVARAS
jgi:LysR family transcriptional regulator for metE and metH